MSAGVRREKFAFTLDLSGDDETPAVNIEHYRYAGVLIETDSVADNTGEFFIEVRALEVGTNTPSGWARLDVTIPALASADAVLASGLILAPFEEMRVAFDVAGGSPAGTAAVHVCIKD